MDSIMNQLRLLFSARRFLLLHMELPIHHSRIRSFLGQIKTDTTQIKAYVNILSTGKLTPSSTDPVHLRWELLQINSYPQDFPYLRTPTEIFGITTDT